MQEGIEDGGSEKASFLSFVFQRENQESYLMDKGECTQSAFCQHRVHHIQDGNAEIIAFTECIVAKAIVHIFFFF